MRYTMTFLENTYNKLTKHLFQAVQVEQAAYLLCTISRSPREIRFIAKEVHPISSSDLLIQDCDLLSIPSNSFVPILKRANDSKHCFFLVHSHPQYYPDFSPADDREEPKLFRSAYIRIEGGIHGSLVFNSPSSVAARVWLENEDELIAKPIDSIRILGHRYKIITSNNNFVSASGSNEIFDRQVRVFGPDLQKTLQRLTIGVVGCGGTGSATLELLARLGVGKIIAFDHDTVEDTNITRIHGSKKADVGNLKVHLMREMIEGINLGSQIEVVPNKIIYKSAAEKLKECDIIFGCTDDNAGRSILNQMMIRYFIPVIDMGVLIDSRSGLITSILGRVTILSPDKPCLLCRNRIDTSLIAAEMMPPDVYEARRKEGYVPELGRADPAVITFTTSIASQSVNEMLELLTGFMGSEECSEVIYRFDARKIMRYQEPQRLQGCPCGNDFIRGSGDMPDFLGTSWPQE